MTMIISGSDGLEFPDGSDQTSAFTGNAAAITSGTIATARLATGTANSSTYLRGDQTWATIASSQWTTTGSNIYYNTGNVGIGTSNPSVKLDIVGGDFVVANGADAGNAGGSVFFKTSANSTYTAMSSVKGLLENATASEQQGGIGFSTRPVGSSGQSLTERMRITAAGDVGIGTSSPALKLDVAGRAQFTNSGFNYVLVDSTLSDSYFRLAAAGTVKWYVRNNISRSHNLEITPDGGTTSGMFLTQAGLMQFNSGYGSVATAYGCRAWVNFNGTGTIAIRGSGNVSSITDLGAGLYQPNYTSAMPDVNYAVTVAGAGSRDASGGNDSFNIRSPSVNFVGASSVTTGYVQISHKDPVGTLFDSDVVCVTIFR